MVPRYPSTDTELKDKVRAETSYDDTADELPTTQLDELVGQSKAYVELSTGSDAWYRDDGLGFALVAYTCMRVKSAVENISLSSYTLGDEQVSFDTDDPEDSQQLESWADDVVVGLSASNVDDSTRPQIRDSANYVGESHVYDDHRHNHY
jgi:hypothetical protein